ncbi:MAG: hypothetical protein K5835_18790 [Microbacterium sp.]|nr:hypothetical protein [Microbacterium sp.]
MVADMEAFWVAYDAAETEAEKLELHRRFLLDHGGRYADYRDSIAARVERRIIGGLEPVRFPE